MEHGVVGLFYLFIFYFFFKNCVEPSTRAGFLFPAAPSNSILNQSVGDALGHESVKFATRVGKVVCLIG